MHRAAYIGLSQTVRIATFPFASLTPHREERRDASQGGEDRVDSLGADHEPCEADQRPAEERRLLKEERAKRQAQAQRPRAKAIDKVRAHHPEAKRSPRKKTAERGQGRKGAQDLVRRKHVAHAAALQAASRAPKKAAKT
jgi:hypothetical protein